MRALDPHWQGALDRRPAGRRLAGGGGGAGRRLDAAPLLEPARQRTVLLLGHEREGIPEELVESADACIEIPMVGVGASLNVAVAGSLVLYRLAGMA